MFTLIFLSFLQIFANSYESGKLMNSDNTSSSIETYTPGHNYFSSDQKIIIGATVTICSILIIICIIVTIKCRRKKTTTTILDDIIESPDRPYSVPEIGAM